LTIDSIGGYVVSLQKTIGFGTDEAVVELVVVFELPPPPPQAARVEANATIPSSGRKRFTDLSS
jgi:hypothetical protein